MANPTDRVPVFHTTYADTKHQWPLAATAQTYYVGEMIGLNVSGYATKYDDTAALKFVGINAESARIIVDSDDAAGAKLINTDRPPLLMMLIASAAIGDEGKKVYAKYSNEVQYTDGTYANYVGTVLWVQDSTHVVIAPFWSPFHAMGGSYNGTIAAAATGTTTLTECDVNKIVHVPNTAAVTIALPAGGDRPQAVSGVSFEVQKEEILCLVGESGSGKSVIAHTVMGLLPKPLRVSGGQIRLEGEDLVAAGEKRLRERPAYRKLVDVPLS